MTAVDVDALLERMTVEEKVAQLGAVWFSPLLRPGGEVDLEAARMQLRDGIGHITRISSESGLPPDRTAALANELQRVVLEETRLGIPAIVHEEALAGLCGRGATQFPQAIGMAATWNPELMRDVASAIREHLVAVGARQALSPVLDIARDPRWGRLEETYGEDPYLASRMAVAFVAGLQTDDLRSGVAATGKHFLAYGVPEGGMNHSSAIIGPRLLRDVIAAPFRAAVGEAGLASIMAAYNDVDGLPCHASPEILDSLLREELGFDGVVVADYWGVQLLKTWHGVARDDDDTAALAITAGVDLELPTTYAYGRLPALIAEGRVAESVVDRSCRRVLELKERLGLFEEPYVRCDSAAGEAFDRPEHRRLARQAAEQSTVVATNDGVLPLTAGSRIALIGPAADDGRLLLGDYSYPAHVEIMHEEAGDSASSWRAVLPPLEAVPIVTVLEGLRALGVRVTHAPGCGISVRDRSGFRGAVELAGASDVAIVCVGGRSGLTRTSTSGEFRDASDLSLPGVQAELVDAVLETTTPTVVVLVGGRVHALPAVAERAAALVWAWLPGEEGGAAVARVLTGEVPPSGRLPVTVPRTVGQVPIHHDHLSGAGRSQMLGDYVDGPSAPLFAFGHGLSYTAFEYSSLEISLDAAQRTLDVDLSLRNVGESPGVEVPQVYVHDDVASVARPVRSLVGFARVDLAPGAGAGVRFTIDLARLGFHDRGLRYTVEPGTFTVMVGASAGDIRLTDRFEWPGDPLHPDPNTMRPTKVTVRHPPEPEVAGRGT